MIELINGVICLGSNVNLYKLNGTSINTTVNQENVLILRYYIMLVKHEMVIIKHHFTYHSTLVLQTVLQIVILINKSVISFIKNFRHEIFLLNNEDLIWIL